MSGRKKTDILLENVVIEKVAAEGKAIAHVDGRVLFVPFAVPGDVVNVRVFKAKESYMEGFITQIVKPSAQRQEPLCAHFGICGGCRWQPLPYSMQLEAKQQQVYDQLVRIGHLEVPPLSPILPSERTEYYRNKLEFSFSSKRWFLEGENPDELSDNERVALGFHVGKFFDKVLDIKQCHLQREPSNAIRLFIKQYALDHGLEFFDIREKRGFLRNMFIRTAENGQLMLILCFAREDEPKRKAILDAISGAFPEITSLYYVINPKGNDSISDLQCHLYKGEEAIYETMENLSFKIGPKSFFQTNSRQAYRLYCVVRDFAEIAPSETVYDLYTGTGTIAMFVSGKAAKVIGIEYVPEAIEDARSNALRNSISNCEFFAGDMKDILNDEFINIHGKPDVIITDPPRAGMHKDVVQTIIDASPARIVYVSCNPATQARDLAILDQFYKVQKVQPVDMFPHTQHVENVVLLTRR